MNKGVAQIPNSAYGLWPSGRIPYVFSTVFSIFFLSFNNIKFYILHIF